MRRLFRQLWIPVVLLLVLMAAYVVRVHALGAQSLWYDEGVAFGHSQRALLDMIPLLQRNVHVPAYFWSLAVWEDAAGASEFSLRYLSVLFSLVSVAFTYSLGRLLYGRVAGLAAAGFVTLNTFSIYYAQEARMYAMLAAVSAASMWAFFLWTQAYQRQRRIFEWSIALALINALGMYTHFSYALVMVSQGVLAALWLLWLWAGAIRIERPYTRLRSRHVRLGMEPIYTIVATLRALSIYVVLNLITVALFSPWIEVALRQTSSQPNISQPIPIEEMARILQGWFAFGVTFEDHMGGMGAAVTFFLLFGLLTQPGRARGQVWRMLIPVVWVLVSSAIYVYLGLYERYLRFLTPAEIGFALWMGRGVWNLWTMRPRRRARWAQGILRFAAGFATLALWLTMAQGVPLLSTSPRYLRDDYRGLAAAIAAQSTPSDRVILSAPGLHEVFSYYYRGSAPVVLMPLTDNPTAEAKAVIANSRLMQVVFYGEREQDPNGLVERTLSAEAYGIDARWWGNLRWVRYAAPRRLQVVDLPPIRFGEQIELVGVQVGQTIRPAGDPDPLLIDLTWQTDSPILERYTVFVQILSDNGALVAQRDSEPASATRPTTTWEPGERVVDRHALLVHTLPAGSYRIIVGLYLPATGERLPVLEGSFLTLSSLLVTG
jgi:mannosyltransferase